MPRALFVGRRSPDSRLPLAPCRRPLCHPPLAMVDWNGMDYMESFGITIGHLRTVGHVSKDSRTPRTGRITCKDSRTPLDCKSLVAARATCSTTVGS